MSGWGRSVRMVAAATAALAFVGCAGGDSLTLPARSGPETSLGGEATAQRIPTGTIRVAYPDVPGDWLGTDPVDTAATDLASLWGLPLFAYDPEGQLVPRLVTDVSFPDLAEGWAVDLRLAEGRWSDGSPVTADDVAATVDALRELRPDEWNVLDAVEVVERQQVRLHFREAHGRWAHLLAGGPGVLPRSELDASGLEAYGTDLPVTGGPFVLERHDPGHSAVFVAHRDGPLGPPAAERVEVLFVPSYETALGLLDRGAVEVVVGHLALNPVTRAERLDGVSAAAPIGGTTVSLEWLEAGSLGTSATVRRNAFAALDLEELVAGLLSGIGVPATSPVPGTQGPLDGATREQAVEPLEREVVVLVPRWHEAVAFTSRAIQRDLTAAGGVARLVTVPTPDLLDPVEPHDGALRIRRWSPRPAIGGIGDVVAPGPDDVVARELAPRFSELRDESWEEPLYRIGVAHAWTDDLAGVEASSWPGLGFWNAADWTLSADG